MNEAIYIAEFRSISHGIGALDVMCKRTELKLLYAAPVCIGKYLICVGGDVGNITEAQTAAETDGEELPFASCLLTGIHTSILEYFRKEQAHIDKIPAAIGVFETNNAASGFHSLDQALKGAQATLMRVWIGNRLGGKLCWVIGGSTSDVQSAITAAKGAVPDSEQAGNRIIIAPDSFVADLFLNKNPDINT